MTTKVERSGLLSVVNDLVQEDPEISDQRIANKLMKDYGDKLENGKITWYAVRNARKKLDNTRIEKLAEDKDSVAEIAESEFNRILKDGAEKAEAIYQEAKENGDLGIALKGLEQIRKNWVSMMDYYKRHVIAPIQNLTINEDKKIIVQLQQYNELLCPVCRERVNREILLDND